MERERHPPDEPSSAGPEHLRRRVTSRLAVALLAVGLPVVISVVTFVVDEADGDFRLGTAYMAAIGATAALAGPRAGLVASAVSAVGFWYTVVPPVNTVASKFPEGAVSVTVFCASAAAVILVVFQRDRAARRAVSYEERYRRLADAGLIGVIFWELGGPITDANDAVLSMLGFGRDDLVGGRIDWKAMTPAEYRELDEQKVEDLLRQGFNEPYEKEYLRADGTRVPVLVGSAFLEHSQTHGISFVLDLSERWALEAERQRLLDAEMVARAEAEAANRRLEIVASASASLMEDLEPEQVLHRLAHAVVPDLADAASVFVPEGGLLRRALTVHATRPDLAELLTRRYPVTMASGSPAAEAFRTGRTVRVEEFSLGVHSPISDDPDYVRLVQDMQLRGGASIPLRLGREVLGVLSLSGTRDRGPVEPAAVLAAEQIAERAALALQHARSFEAERTVATLMQQALLPDGPRTVPGHDVGSCYVPAAQGREVGGDWWDIVSLPDGRVALMVGDVTGHGVHVAPTMAKMRHAIDAVLVHGAGPAEAVETASRLLEISRPGAYATAFVATYDPERRELCYSLAGHPPPVVLTGDGARTLDGGGGTLLGLNLGPRTEATEVLPEDFELIAFTDGLVERRDRSYDEGVERLVEAARRLPAGLTGPARAERLVAQLVGTEGRDDVCVVTVRPDRSCG